MADTQQFSAIEGEAQVAELQKQVKQLQLELVHKNELLQRALAQKKRVVGTDKRALALHWQHRGIDKRTSARLAQAAMQLGW